MVDRPPIQAESAPPSRLATVMGLAAILLWSSTVAVTRRLTEPLGPLTTGATIYLGAGLVGAVGLMATPGAWRRLVRSSGRYLLGCGAAFVVYATAINLAIGWASGRQQVLEVGLINYLWPGLTLLLSVPLLGKRARRGLVPSAVVGVIGVALVTFQGRPFSFQTLAENLRTNGWPYLLAFLAAVAWALYSNLARRWGGPERSGAVPVFFLASGAVLALLQLVSNEAPAWSVEVLPELAFMIVPATLVPYLLWDAAMRRGNVVVVAACSYLTPLLSLLIAVHYLDAPATSLLWVGGVLVILSAIGCRFSLEDR